MRLTALLCDAAQVAEGKLYVIGGGWSVTGPMPVPSAIAILLEVPWTDANRQIGFEVQLFDQDGQPVHQPSADGTDQPVRVDAQFEVGRPAGLAEGTPLMMPLAIAMPPLVLAPARRFSWEFTIDGTTQSDWHLSFSTRPAPPAGVGPTAF
jgi:hypothetical protein